MAPRVGCLRFDLLGSAVKTYSFRGALTASVDAAGNVKLGYKGKAVGTLREGRYTTTVTDKAKNAGFFFKQLSKNGGVVTFLTMSNAPFVGTRTASVTLKKGQWVFLASGSGKKTYFVVVG